MLNWLLIIIINVGGVVVHTEVVSSISWITMGDKNVVFSYQFNHILQMLYKEIYMQICHTF